MPTGRGDKIAAQVARHQLAQSRQSKCNASSEKRFAWLHIPKTGSSIATALLHLGNNSLPSGARLPTCSSSGILVKSEMRDREVLSQETCQQVLRRGQPMRVCRNVSVERCVGGQAELTFLKRFPLSVHFPCTFWEHNDGNIGSHSAIDEASYRRFAGKFVGMFRSPRARAVSAFLWFRNAFPESTRPNASSYARRVIGTATRMVAGQAGGMDCGSAYGSCRPDAAAPDIRLALKRLRHGFKFVGLTEEWPLSICLLHSLFGGRCHGVEFENARPSEASAHGNAYWGARLKAAATTAVASVADPYDEQLYAAARQRFWSDVRAQGLSAGRCSELCPANRQHFVGIDFGLLPIHGSVGAYGKL